MKRQTFGIIIIIIVALSAGIYAFMFAGYNGVISEKPIMKNSTVNSDPEKDSDRTVSIYMIGVENNELVLKAMDVRISASDEPVEATIQAFIEQQDTTDLGNPIPDGTRIQSVRIDGDIATIDFSREFVDGFAGGAEEESLLIKAITKTVGQFDTIHKIMLKADGEPVNTLGHLDISEPIMIDYTRSENGASNI
ncbi:MAG: GerMN domain-containing protein [Armatimonadota bacterium]